MIHAFSMKMYSSHCTRRQLKQPFAPVRLADERKIIQKNPTFYLQQNRTRLQIKPIIFLL